MIRVFLWGCASSVPALAVEIMTGAELRQEDLWESAKASFLVIAPIEEFFKLSAVWIAVYRSDFREPRDGILYAATCALGFASMENILHIALMGPGILVARTIYATPAHVMFAAMWGYSLGLARFRRNDELIIIAKGFLLATILHGVYDFVVALNPSMAMLSLIPLMVFMGWLMHRRIKEVDQHFPFEFIGEGAVVLCPNCGAYTLEGEDMCSRCGEALPLIPVDSPRFCGKCRVSLSACHQLCPRCGNPIAAAHDSLYGCVKTENAFSHEY
jgi:rRNA maturation protein Nop10